MASSFHGKLVAALIGASAVAGCSADVSRFDLGSTNFSETSSTSPSSYGSNPAFATSARDQGGGYGAPYGGGTAVARSELAPPEGPAQAAPPSMTTSAIGQQPRYQTQGQTPPGGYPADQYLPHNSPISAGAPMTRSPKSAAVATEKGEAIEVKAGDTLYKISREHQVSVADLMSVNDLKSPALKPGQRLYLPSQKMASGKAPTKAAIKLPKAETPPSSLAQATPSDWSGSYTVKPGDSLYQVARDHKVKLAELQSNNGISDGRKVKPGTVLKVPGAATTTPATASASAPASSGSSSGTASDSAQVQPGSPVVPPAVAPTSSPASTAQATPSAPSATTPSSSTPAASTSETPAATSQSVQPTILNSAPAAPAGEQKVASAETPNVASDAQGAQASAPGSGSVASKLRWPVTGKIVAQFGPRSDGTHNDGVNIAVPMGTDVKAAEGGVVAYAGDELKGYGNLVLVRHDNGWVTAYAHNDKIIVQRGEHVKRGQIIAKTGRTGQVDQPQLHFELRQGQKPVDPSPFMENM